MWIRTWPTLDSDATRGWWKRRVRIWVGSRVTCSTRVRDFIFLSWSVPEADRDRCGQTRSRGAAITTSPLRCYHFEASEKTRFAPAYRKAVCYFPTTTQDIVTAEIRAAIPRDPARSFGFPSTDPSETDPEMPWLCEFDGR